MKERSETPGAPKEERIEREDEATIAAREAERRRHEMAVAERARRAKLADVNVNTTAATPARPPQPKKTGKLPRHEATLMQLEHAEFTTEEARERRAISGFKKQETEHEKKLARDAAKAASAAKEAKAAASANAEAKTHVVPPPPSLGELVEAQLSLQELQ